MSLKSLLVILTSCLACNLFAASTPISEAQAEKEIKQQSLDALLFTRSAFIYPEFAQKLVDMGANVNAEDGGLTVLGAAISRICYDGTYEGTLEVPPIVRFLVGKGANVKTNPEDGETALHVACYSNLTTFTIPLIDYLLKNGADINAKDRNGNTPLHVASSTAVVRHLLSKGANVNAENDSGETPIFIFVGSYSPQSQTLELLIKAGAKLDHVTSYGTILHYCNSSPLWFEYFMEKGVDPSIPDQDGKLPIVSLADYFDCSYAVDDYRKGLLMNALSRSGLGRK